MTDKTQIEIQVAEARAELAEATTQWHISQAKKETLKLRRAESQGSWPVPRPDPVEQMQADRAETNDFITMTSRAWALHQLLSSPAFAAQFDELLKEVELMCRGIALQEGSGGPVYSLDVEDLNTARDRLRRFVIGESK